MFINLEEKMAFIGIIADNKYQMNLKKALDNLLNKLNKEHTIIAIDKTSISNIKNIRFETILVLGIEDVKGQEEILNELFKNSKYLAINADMSHGLEIINNMKLNIITFGFNSKSTITASSVEENFLICLQRKIIDINKKTLEPQELQLKIPYRRMLNNSHNLMGIASILLIYGKKTEFF